MPHYWPFVRGIPRRPVDSPCRGPVIWSFAVFFVVSITICWTNNQEWGVHLNIKMLSYQYRDSHYKDKMASRLFYMFIMEIPILGKTFFILRRGPGSWWFEKPRHSYDVIVMSIFSPVVGRNLKHRLMMAQAADMRRTSMRSSDYGNIIVNTLNSLRKNDELCDFTVSAEGKSIRVSDQCLRIWSLWLADRQKSGITSSKNYCYIIH